METSRYINFKRVVSFVSTVTFAASSVAAGGQGPQTLQEVQNSLGLNPLHAPACQDNPNTLQDERSSQACLDVYNACNGNPQKPVEKRRKGCLDRYTVVYNASGQVVSFRPELTGYTSSVVNGVTLYTPISEVAVMSQRNK